MSDEGAFISLPEMLVASPRTHQRFAREAMEQELDHHHRAVMPEHFKQSAHQKYGHKPRSPKYIAYKIRRWRSGTDHVASGRTKVELLYKRQILVDGSGETLRGRLKMRLPFGGGTGEQVDDDFYRRLEAALATETNPGKRAWILKRLQNRDNNRGKVGVTPAEQIKELQTITGEEARQATERIAQRYLGKIKSMKRRRLMPGVTV